MGDRGKFNIPNWEGTMTTRNFFYCFVVFLSASTLIANDPVQIEPGKTYSIQLGSYLTIELPKGETYSLSVSNNSWENELLLNHIWLKPNKLNSNIQVTISNSKGEQLKFSAISKESISGPQHHKIIVKKFPSAREEKQETYHQPTNPKSIHKKQTEKTIQHIRQNLEKSRLITETKSVKDLLAEKSIKEEANTKKKIDFFTQINLLGGMEKSDKSYFNMLGDIVIAGKADSGLFIQGAGMVSMNELIKEYGFSTGIGYEPDQLGFFLFGDALFYKFGESDTTIHFQIRPGLRLKTQRVMASAFYAVPLSNDRYSGIDIDENGISYEIFNRALSHAGFSIKALIINNLHLDMSVALASEKAMKLILGASYHILDRVLLNFAYQYSDYGNYPILAGDGFENASRFSIGVSYMSGGTSHLTNLNNMVVFKPQYPLIVTVKKQKDGGNQDLQENNSERNKLTVTLVGTPRRGPAPLDVEFEATLTTPADSTGPYKMKWFFTGKKTSISSSEEANYIYPIPGKFEAYVEVTDTQRGYKGESNRVQIEVLDPSQQTYTIIATSGPNGSIAPEGETSYEEGADQQFEFSPNTGYRIKSVTVDNGNPFLANQYEFKDIQADHKIHVEFEEGSGNITTYTISSTSGNGGSNNPEGDVLVYEGNDLTVNINPVTGYRIIDVRVNGSSQGAISSYTFSDVSSDGTIHSTFERVSYTITAIANTGGSISPSGDVSVDEGENQTFIINANTGYAISDVYVNGQPQGAIPSYTFTNVQSNGTIIADFLPLQHQIIATRTSGGNISPLGTSTVDHGDDLTININPNTGRRIGFVEVDGSRISNPGNSYTFSNITEDHTFHVSFSAQDFTITSSAESGGSISPLGTREYDWDDDASYRIRANSGYVIDRILVDGSPISFGNIVDFTYTFNNIRANHTIHAEFRASRMFLIQANGYTRISTSMPYDPTFVWLGEYFEEGRDAVVTWSDPRQNQSGLWFHVDFVIIDGINRGKISSWTFNNLSSNKTFDIYGTNIP